VAQWQLDNPGRHHLGDWATAPFHNGLVAMGIAANDERFLNAAHDIGKRLNWTPVQTQWEANDHAAIQTFLELYLLEPDLKRLTPSRTRLDSAIIAVESLDTELTFIPKNYGKWSWCDALYMSPPAYVMLAKATGENRYLDFVDEWWWKLSDFLYDESEHLFFRDQTFFNQRESNGEKVFWSRGNGWVFAGLVRVLKYLPPDHPTRPRYEQQFKEMAARMVTLQQPDGFWHASLLDPKAFPHPETSGTGFFVYGLAWGVNSGLLPAPEYRLAARRGWLALTTAVQTDGKLGWVQRIGDSPVNTAKGDTESYGAGSFLLAGSEMFQMTSRAFMDRRF